MRALTCQTMTSVCVLVFYRMTCSKHLLLSHLITQTTITATQSHRLLFLNAFFFLLGIQTVGSQPEAGCTVSAHSETNPDTDGKLFHSQHDSEPQKNVTTRRLGGQKTPHPGTVTTSNPDSWTDTFLFHFNPFKIQIESSVTT